MMAAPKRARALTSKERDALSRAHETLRGGVGELAGMVEQFDRLLRDMRWAVTIADDTLSATKGEA
jgi:hypothetical protein